MELYLSASQSMVPVIGALETLKIAYTQHDIDTDNVAHDQLFKLTGSLTVPTLVFDDGSVLVDPTPVQFASKMQALFSLTEKPSEQPIKWSLTKVIFALLLGIGTFSLGFALEITTGLTSPSGVLLTVLVLMIIFMFLALLPPFKRLLHGLSKNKVWKVTKWILIPFYTGLLGLSAAAQHGQVSMLVWIAAITICVTVFILLAAATWPLWGSKLAMIEKWQHRLSLVVLVSFIVTFILISAIRQPQVLHLLLLSQLILFLFLLLPSIFQLASHIPKQSGIDHATSTLFCCVGLFIITSFLLI